MTAVYLYKDDKVLLLYRIGSRVADRMYVGSAGGHFEKDEVNDAKACALRELKEELGLTEDDIHNLELRYVAMRLKENEIRQNYYFFAELKDTVKALKSPEGNLEWFTFEDALACEMPVCAKYAFEHFVKEGKNTNKLYAGVATEQGITFTELKEF